MRVWKRPQLIQARLLWTWDQTKRLTSSRKCVASIGWYTSDSQSRQCGCAVERQASGDGYSVNNQGSSTTCTPGCRVRFFPQSALPSLNLSTFLSFLVFGGGQSIPPFFLLNSSFSISRRRDCPFFSNHDPSRPGPSLLEHVRPFFYERPCLSCCTYSASSMFTPITIPRFLRANRHCSSSLSKRLEPHSLTSK